MYTRLFALLALLFLAPATTATAATLERHSDPYMHCFVRLSGVIEKGDADRLKALLIRIYGSANAYDPLYSDEYHGQRLCLDSQGGSFAEAIRIADLISGKLGTAIPRDATCLSACSVIFMAGSVSTESDAGLVANRKLHAGGKLGFHAPSLVVPGGSYTEEQVNIAYKIAVRGIGDLLERSGDMKVSHTLVSKMLQTPPEDFFYIDTVHKAGRWLIPVVGTYHPAEITPLAVSNACNSFYNWEGDRISTNGFGFDPEPTDRWGWEVQVTRTSDGVEARQEGYGQEGALSCNIRLEADVTAATEVGAYSYFGSFGNIRIGQDGLGFDASPALFFDPRTKLADLVRPSDQQIATRDVAELSPIDRSSAQTTCYVFRGQDKLDEDPCTRLTTRKISSTLHEYQLDEFVWPSGAKTVIEDTVNGDRINGLEAKLLFTDKPVSNSRCYLNTSSGNTFCFKD